MTHKFSSWIILLALLADVYLLHRLPNLLPFQQLIALLNQPAPIGPTQKSQKEQGNIG